MSPDLQQARATLAMFTRERPMMLSQMQYDAVMKEPGLSDLMDRVRVTAPLPTNRLAKRP